MMATQKEMSYKSYFKHAIKKWVDAILNVILKPMNMLVS